MNILTTAYNNLPDTGGHSETRAVLIVGAGLVIAGCIPKLRDKLAERRTRA